MELKRIETPAISHYAYLITDGQVGALVDPRRDVAEYLEVAREAGCRITHILETHRQEDFVMGSSHLRDLTGAKVVNGAHELFGRGDLRLEDGEHFEVGKLRFQALHTPGHTPESMCYVVLDSETDQPWGVFTGDTLFFGDTGRSDLPDADRAEENAGKIHDSVHGKLAGLGDQTLVLPAHGPGSVCGSGMAQRPGSTLGMEKEYNAVFQLSREQFAKKKGGERLPRPPYFRHMEKVNLQGGIPPVFSSGQVPLQTPKELGEGAADAVVIDCREPEAYAGAHVPDSHSVWMGGLPVFGGWVATHDSPILLVTAQQDEIDTAVLHLSRIGLDNIRGALKGGFGQWRASGEPLRHHPTITPQELGPQCSDWQVLDVREPDEYAAGHIPGAKTMYVGDLAEQWKSLKLDRDQPLVVTCGVGHRASVGVAILLQQGFKDVRNLIGGMSTWKALKFPLEQGD